MYEENIDTYDLDELWAVLDYVGRVLLIGDEDNTIIMSESNDVDLSGQEWLQPIIKLYDLPTNSRELTIALEYMGGLRIV